ncbi:TolC family outer membrane protein [Pseudoroseomonas globiformis]|uniref:TolC family outer membrane protein n=1 Tax=Teichococcus globiformis TaxID=2307229 RepID=A0ABV7FYX9_9PROT
MSRLAYKALLLGGLTMAPLLLAGGFAKGQTLQEALAQAYANNPGLQAARAQLRVVDENVPQALAGWRPSVVLGASGGYIDGTARSRGQYADVGRQIGSLQATVTQPLYTGGRTVAQTRRAENQVLAQRARLLAAEQQVLSDVVSAYVAVIRDQETLRLNVNNVQVLQRQLDATNERFRVGEITRTDVAQAESRLAGARSARANAEGTLQTSRATFQRVVGVPPERLIAPQPLSAAATSAAQAAEIAMRNNPQVVAALFDEASARDAVDVQMAALLPTVSVQAQAFRSDNSQQPNSRITGEQITANLSVPLYQGGGEHAAVRQARQDAVRLRQLVDDQRRQAMQQSTQAWEQLQSTRAQVDSVRSQIRAAEIALDGVQREAVVGSRTTLDVLNAEQELLNARVSLVQALSNVITASYGLAGSVGRLTARDLALPVTQYDMEAYYNTVRGKLFGTGDVSERR